MNSLWILLACCFACAYAHPTCDQTSLSKCDLYTFNTGEDDFFPSDPVKLNKLCGQAMPGYACYVDVFNKCPEIATQSVKDYYQSSKHLISKICTPGDFQEKYLRNAKCMSYVYASKRSVCEENNAFIAEISSCLHIKAIEGCVNTFIRNTCGSEAFEVYKENFIPIFENFACDV